jgi:type III pantothenate kinase
VDLLIDIGNTSLKWATWSAGELGEMRSVRHHGGVPIDLHAAWEVLDPPERILASNVGGETIGAALRRVCRSRWGRESQFVRTLASSHGVTVAYERPESLGVDRWLAMLAARRLTRGPALIVDAGTAVTYDLLDADGRHRGGLILPGIEMMRDSLLSGTRIPRVDAADTPALWATATAGAIAAGPVQAVAALAGRLADRLQALIQAEATVIVTGGDAKRVLPALDRPSRCEPSLVLQGLALIS